MLYFFFGQEEFNIEIEIEKIKSKTVDKTFVAANYRVYNNPVFSELIEILQSAPLMFGKVLSVINCEKYFFDIKGKINFEDKELKILENILQTVPDALTVIFVCKIPRDEIKKIDTRRKIYKIISKYAQISEFPEFKPYQKEYAAWIQKRLKQKELFASSDTVSFLIERLGTNLRIVDNELEKIKLSIYPEKNIKNADIEKICTSTQDIFLLTDYILLGKKDLALSEYKKLCTEKHYLEIAAVLQTNFSRLLGLKVDSLSMSASEISRKTGMHEFVVKKQLEKLKNIPADKIIGIRRRLLEAEYLMKSGDMQFGDLAVELAIMG